MTFLNKLPELLLKTFFGCFLLVNSIYSIYRYESPNDNITLGLILLIFLFSVPYKKAGEVFGPSGLEGWQEAVSLVASVALSVFFLSLGIFFFMILSSVLGGEESGKNFFNILFDFFYEHGLLLVLWLFLFIGITGVIRWFFANTTSYRVKKGDYWLQMLSFLLYTASFLVNLTSGLFGKGEKFIFTVCFAICLWEELKSAKIYCHCEPEDDDDPEAKVPVSAS